MYWFTGLFGLALAVAPFFQDYQDHTIALWASIVLGGVIFVASLLEAVDGQQARWEWWITGLAGVLAALTPLVFGFALLTAELWTLLILGLLIVILAGYELCFAESPFAPPRQGHS